MEIYSLGLVRSLPIAIKELLLMAVSQNGFLFVQVSHKALFLDHCYFYSTLTKSITLFPTVLLSYLLMTLPYTSKLFQLMMKLSLLEGS